MAGCRRKNDASRGRLPAKTFSSDTGFYRYHSSSLLSLQREERKRERDTIFWTSWRFLTEERCKNRLLRGWQRSMGVDSSRWITLEIENDALKTSSVRRGFKAFDSTPISSSLSLSLSLSLFRRLAFPSAEKRGIFPWFRSVIPLSNW